MSRNRFLALTVRPDVVAATATKKAPSMLGKAPLQVAPLHFYSYTNRCTNIPPPFAVAPVLGLQIDSDWGQ